MTSDDAKPTHRVHIYMAREQIRAIDAWRGAREGVPSRAEAIRRLVEIALEVERARQAGVEHVPARGAGGHWTKSADRAISAE